MSQLSFALLNPLLVSHNILSESVIFSSWIVVLSDDLLSPAQETYLGRVRILQVSYQILLHALKFAYALPKSVDIFLFETLKVFTILGEALINDFTCRLSQGVLVMASHLFNQVQDLLDFSTMSLSQVLGFFLCLLDIRTDFISKVVDRILLDCFVDCLHLFLTLCLFLTIYFLRNFLYDLMTMQKILLLLVIGKNPSLKWSPLTCDFSCTSLHKLNRLRHRDHTLGLD